MQQVGRRCVFFVLVVRTEPDRVGSFFFFCGFRVDSHPVFPKGCKMGIDYVHRRQVHRGAGTRERHPAAEEVRCEEGEVSQQAHPPAVTGLATWRTPPGRFCEDVWQGGVSGRTA